MPSLVQRYRRGEYHQVWKELIEQNFPFQEESYYREAYDVGKEMIYRAKQNLTILIERLREMDYQFAYQDRIWLPPSPLLLTKLQFVEQHYGSLPIVLRLWFEIIGQVRLMGTHPKLSRYQGLTHENQQGPISDPLVVVWYDMEEDEEGNVIPPYALEIAPDISHKANYSGGSGVYVILPHRGFDAPLISKSRSNQYFVSYLRTSFTWGGFPGFANAPNEATRSHKELAFLTKDLLPI